jgi:hypothetical protein
MESCSLSSYLKFILDVHNFEKIARQNNDQQTAALTLFHRYLSIDAKYAIPIDDEIRRTTLCKTNYSIILWKFCLLFLALICPSSNNTIPDPDCFRIAREYAWELIEQKFVFIISELGIIDFCLVHFLHIYPVLIILIIN